ncbi:MAG: sigma factor-like helix-turn-helix DNA-binding protein [Propionibacteriaceae bacterium]
MLRELQGLSYLEIATIAHSPESTVRGRIARARCHLEKGMGRWQ